MKPIQPWLGFVQINRTLSTIIYINWHFGLYKLFSSHLSSFKINNFQSQACKEDIGLELGLASTYSVSKGNDIEIKYENI